MAFGFTTYVKPGVYTEELRVPSGGNIVTQPFALCLVGTGSRAKTVFNEAVVRGIVKNEALAASATLPTPSQSIGTASPHTAVLANRSNRKIENTIFYRTLGVNSDPVAIPAAYYSYNLAAILGTTNEPYNLTTGTPDANAFALEMDGKTPITVIMRPLEAGTLSGTVANTTNTTITTSAAHRLAVGNRIFITGVVGTATGLNDAAGFLVTAVPSTTTFTIDNAVAPGGTSITGGQMNVARVGTQVATYSTLNTVGAAATRAEVAAAINIALNAMSDSVLGTGKGYGPTYASAASDGTTGVAITSKLVAGDALSDVRIFAPPTTAVGVDGASALTIIFGAASGNNRDSSSILTLADAYWNASATYKVTYVKFEDDTDLLAQTSGISKLVRVGLSAGSSDYTEITDWVLTGQEVDWSPDTAATLTSTVKLSTTLADTATDLDDGVDDLLTIEMDGRDPLDLDLVQALAGSSEPTVSGFVFGASISTLANLVTNINALMASSAKYGPRYASVASAVAIAGGGTTLRLTSPVQGTTSSIRVTGPSEDSALSTIFGAVANPHESNPGTGKRPGIGAAYYVTYEYTRPETDYDRPIRYFDQESVTDQVGGISVNTVGYNPLAIGASLAFLNGAQTVYTVQINDSTTEGNPTRAQVQSALDAAGTTSGATDVCVISEPGTRLDTTTDLIAHLEDQCSPLRKHYRRIWCGMARSTAIGDMSTSNTWVYRARRTLQVSPDSAGRGRMFLVAPPQLAGVSIELTTQEGLVIDLNVDSTYLAAATAARRSALRPYETLTRRSITGFNTDDITSVWKPGEELTLLGSGVCLVSFDGRLGFQEAMSTEGGGAREDSFMVDSTSYQKDTTVTKVEAALDASAIGTVPTSLTEATFTIAIIVQQAITDSIGSGGAGDYLDDSGNVRSFDIRKDVRVARDTVSKTTFKLRYAYNLRYPILRIFAQYSVDAPLLAG